MIRSVPAPTARHPVPVLLVATSLSLFFTHYTGVFFVAGLGLAWLALGRAQDTLQLLRPLLGINSSGVSGARLEWRATDLWTVEGFLEDRFARELNTGFSINDSFQVPKIWGLFLAREWGY